MNSLSFFLLWLTLLLYELAIALGGVYPREAGGVALVSGVALMVHGAVVVSYEGFGPSIFNLAGLVLLAVFALVMAVLMWHKGGSRGSTANRETAPGEPSQHPTSAR